MRKTTQVMLLVVAFIFSVTAMAQSTVTGTVTGSDLNAPLPGANVIEEGTSNGVSTDFDGNFSLSTQASSGNVVVSFVGYGSVTLAFDGDTDLGTIVLNPDTNSLQEVVITGSGVIDLAEDRRTPVAVSTIKKTEIQERAVGNVEVTEILKNTPSTYVQQQTGFGDSQIFLRGFDQTNIGVLLNGQPVNGMEDGRVYWSNWAGIADIANGVQVQRGLGASKLAISSVGGTINLVMKSTDRQKGGFARFLGGNDSYFKGTVSYDTGLSDSGWSFSILLDHWQAHRKWAEGTYGQGQTYFLAAGYKPNDTHSFNFLITGAPQLHGQRWSQSLDVIENDSKFNQHWGYTADFDSTLNRYTGDIDSERQNYYHKPIMNLNWDWTISDKSELSTVLYASWGRGGGTGPRGNGRIRTSDGQIDYYAIEQQNGQIGVGGDYGAPLGAGYIRRSSVNNHQWYGLVSNFNTELTENLSFNVGADVRLYTGDHFRQVADFYGLTGWANDRPDGATVTENFDPTPWASLFDFADEGDRIDYDYSEDINYYGAFTQLEYATEKFSAFFQGSISNQSYQREGRFDDPGKSEKLDKFGYNVKGGASYRIGDNHTFFGNAGFYSRQPFLDNIFKNVRDSNEIFDNPEVDNEEITGLELGYNFESGDFRASFNFYHTDWDNRVESDFDVDDNGTPDDDSDDINLTIFERGIRQVHKGVELDLQYRVSNAVSITGYISGGSWERRGTITVDTFNDDTGELISSVEGINVDGVKITTAPQFTTGLGARARVTDGLTVYGNINYYANHYLNNDNNPTENIGRVKPFSLTDLGLAYNFQLGGQDLSFNANVYNVFDEVRVQGSDRFGFFNTNGVTYNASIKYRF